MIFWSRTRFEWRLRTRSLQLGERTCVMGVVHLEPDTAAGSRWTPGSAMDAAWAKVAIAESVSAVDAGADIVDLRAIAGADSPRRPIPAEQEQDRLLPVLEGLMDLRPKAVVSVEVCHAATAHHAVRLGAEIINDISAPGWDDEMAEVIARSGCGLILRHTRGRPRKWLPHGSMSSDEVVPAVFDGLCERLAMAEAAGIHTEQIVADPGLTLGFGSNKRGAEDVALLAGLGRLRQLGRPLLVGFPLVGYATEPAGNDHSTRARVNQHNGSDFKETHQATIIAGNVTAILAGVHLLRVTDVQAAREAAAVADAVLSCSD